MNSSIGDFPPSSRKVMGPRYMGTKDLLALSHPGSEGVSHRGLGFHHAGNAGLLITNQKHKRDSVHVYRFGREAKTGGYLW